MCFSSLNRFFGAIALAVLVLLAGAAGAGEAHPWDNKRVYYVIEYHGALREKGVLVRRPGSFQKRPCVIVEEENHSYAEHDPSTLIVSTRIKSIASPEGEAMLRQEETVIGQPGRETITVANGEIQFQSTGFFGSSIAIPSTPGVVFEVSGEWLAAQTPQVGKTVRAGIIDRIGRRISWEQVNFRELISPAADGKPAVWLAVYSAEGRPPLFARFTSDGRLLRLDSEGLTYQVVVREDYDRGIIPSGMEPPFEHEATQLPLPVASGQRPQADLSLPPIEPSSGIAPAAPGYGDPEIRLGETVPAWDSFAWLILHASQPEAWLRVLQTSEYSQTDHSGSHAVITALRNAPRVDPLSTLPMSIPGGVQPFLMAYEQMPVADPRVIETARAAIVDSDTGVPEANTLRAVSYLAGWINQNIAVTPWDGRTVSVLQALSGRSADSMGHAKLFATMSRSLGIPSRMCQGFLVQTGKAAFHCWAEAWIAGQWVPVDTTVSRVGLPAGYVLAEHSRPDGQFMINFADFMRAPGLTLTLASAGRETPGRQSAELVVGDRRTYAISENDWMANLYWGFALRLPTAWIGSAKLNSVEIASPDMQASVKCEAMAGDYRAGQQELGSNIASLRSSLDRFRLVDSRVVAFDAAGATPALFIDFTCRQEDKNLRCRQYVIPRRQRAFRISFWAPAETFNDYAPAFDSILASFEF